MFRSTDTTSRVEILPSGALTVISPRGELDIPLAPELSAAVDRVVAADPLIVVLDLRGVDFIDTAGVVAVIDAGRECKANRRQFFLIRGAPHVDRVLHAAGVAGPFEVLDDLDHLGCPQ